MSQIFNFKFIVIGNPGVGKTSLIKNFVEGSFLSEYKSTIGTNLYTKTLEFKSQKPGNNENIEIIVKLVLWDIAGQVQWDIMRPAYYQGSHGVIIVGDLSSKRTFQKIEKFWVNDARQNCKESIPIILLANKNDLKPEISEEEVREIANRCGIERILFTSAKNSYHVQEAFIALTKKCLNIDPLVFVGEV
ncbi:MAG: Rab family GTPase [Promethearchaeota archaeon]